MYYPGAAPPHHQYLVATEKKIPKEGVNKMNIMSKENRVEPAKSTLKMYIDCITAGLL
jgi:hypothetical protein